MRRPIEHRVIDPSILLKVKPDMLPDVLNGMALADGNKPYLLKKTGKYSVEITNCSKQLADCLQKRTQCKQHVVYNRSKSPLYTTLLHIEDSLLDDNGRKRLPKDPKELAGYFACDGHRAYHNNPVMSVTNRTDAEIAQLCKNMGDLCPPLSVKKRKDGKRHDIMFDAADIDLLRRILTKEHGNG